MKKIKEIILELLPVIILIILLIFIRSEIGIVILVILGIIGTFLIKYQKNELYLFLFGAVIGIIFELIGNILLGQSWPEASFFSIPIWLPLSWGYGFIIIRRTGNIIITKTSKKS
jgi:hypothetical protein